MWYYWLIVGAGVICGVGSIAGAITGFAKKGGVVSNLVSLEVGVVLFGAAYLAYGRVAA